MRFLPGGLAAALLLLLCLPAASWAASVSAPARTTCATGPTTIGDTTYGTPCADVIVAPPGVEAVKGGGGDDTILAGPIAAAVPCTAVCLGVGSQTFEGGPGDDVVFGERGNDILRGNAGNDRLYGGIGDDLLEGGPGNDLLAGGFGADSIDGQEGDDYVRGDGTIDHLFDSSGSNDTLSYASGVTPGFGAGIDTGAAGFPSQKNGERGVNLNLSPSAAELNGNDGIAAEGGGFDEVQVGSFETVIGTPFSDYIIGGEAGETIFGGGGADVILGNGGDDRLLGGADGDYLDGGAAGVNSIDGGSGTDNCVNPSGATSCEGTAKAVAPRDSGKVAVGLMTPGAPGLSQLYVTGSGNDDSVTATYAPGTVGLTLSGPAVFDTSASAFVPGCSVSATSASCAVGALDSIVLAGMDGADNLTANGFPQDTGVVILGDEGADTLTGGEGSEDLLVDGRGADQDTLSALGRDDALLHNGGPDQLLGGDGNDLFLSVSICDGETLNGGEGRDNASWARLKDEEGKEGKEGVRARLDAGLVGRFGAAGDPGCAGEALDSMIGIEDLEGSEAADALFGDPGPNQLLGHKGPDEYFAAAGEDSILANSGDSDPVINCGAGFDSAVLDIPTAEYMDATPIECERVRFGAVEDFRTVTELPPPPPLLESPPPPVDRKAPRTRVTAHPAKLLRTAGRRRRVVFRFASSERGSRFRCKLDGKPYRACASPRAYTVALGKHAVRIFAIDAAGNADPTPALFRFRVRRR
jgi:Ca2+-binding RTX toxin-like protein